MFSLCKFADFINLLYPKKDPFLDKNKIVKLKNIRCEK